MSIARSINNQFESSSKPFQFLLQLISNMSSVFLIKTRNQQVIAYELNSIYNMLLPTKVLIVLFLKHFTIYAITVVPIFHPLPSSS